MPALVTVFLVSPAYGIDCTQRLNKEFKDCGWFKSKSIAAVEQKGGSIQGFLFETANMANAKLTDINMSESVFRGATVSDSRFEKVAFRKTKFVGVRFDNVNFNGSDFTDAVFVRCYFHDVDFKKTNLKPEQFIDPIFVASELPSPLRSEPK